MGWDYCIETTRPMLLLAYRMLQNLLGYPALHSSWMLKCQTMLGRCPLRYFIVKCHICIWKQYELGLVGRMVHGDWFQVFA